MFGRLPLPDPGFGARRAGRWLIRSRTGRWSLWSGRRMARRMYCWSWSMTPVRAAVDVRRPGQQAEFTQLAERGLRYNALRPAETARGRAARHRA